MRRALLLAMAAGCATVEKPDVCADFPNRACIALEVIGSDDLLVDQLRVFGLRGFLTTPFNNAPSPPVPVQAFHLPVILAVVPPQFFSGSYQLGVNAMRDGFSIASGTVEGTGFGGLPVHDDKTVELR